jgi:hypothetical protein
MSIEHVFQTNNAFNQYWLDWSNQQTGKPKTEFEQGICTAAAMNWAKKVLKNGPINTFDGIGVDAHTLNAQMATLRRYDNDPKQQCEMVGLELLVDYSAKSRNARGDVVDSVEKVTKLAEEYGDKRAIIFWTKTHTMAYWRSSKNKEFFDIEVGLWRATTTKEITAKMKDIIKNYGPVTGGYVAALPD